MTEILSEPLVHRNVWDSLDIQKRTDWKFAISDSEAAALATQLQRVEGEEVDYDSITSDTFDVSCLVKTLDAALNTIECGSGLALIKNFPVDGFSEDSIRKVFRGFSSTVGTLIVQDTEGTMIDKVYDRGESYSDIRVRGYTTNAELTPHCDSGDVLALLCVRPAQTGGMNYLANALAIYNKILEERPEYIEPLCRGFHYNIRGNGPIGRWQDITRDRVPVFSYHAGRLSVRFNEKAILTAEQLPDVEPLSDLEKSAVRYVAELANSEVFRLPVMLEPGDILLISNYVVLHTRASFEDHSDPQLRRLLFRAWINIPNGRPLLLEFSDHYNTGPRQGPDASHAGDTAS